MRAVAVRAAATATAALLAASAGAGIVTRETIRSGDTVLGSVLAPGDYDEYVFQAPRGATVSLTLGSAAPSGWIARNFGIVDEPYARQLGLFATGASTARTEPMPASGEWRLLVGADGLRLGGYSVKFALTPAKRFATTGTGDAAPAPFLFGALAGSDVAVALRWKGASPVTLDPDLGMTGPDGTALTSASARRVRGSTSAQSGFRTTADGDHALRLVVPPGTKSWSATLTVKPPRPEAPRTRDFRDGAPAEAHSVELIPAGDFVGIRIVGERGGPNDLALLASDPVAGLDPTHPRGVGIDGRGTGCAAVAADAGNPPGSYQFVCQSGATAEMTSVVRQGGRIVAFEAPSIRTARGSGSLTLSGPGGTPHAVYDAAGRPVAWTETRRYDATGRVHVLEVTDVRRDARGVIVGYSVRHTAPGGVVRDADYAPIGTR